MMNMFSKCILAIVLVTSSYGAFAQQLMRDNLGSHVATKDLNLSGFNINAANTVNATTVVASVVLAGTATTLTNSSIALQVDGVDKAILVPRVTDLLNGTTPSIPVANAVNGMIVYDLATSKFYHRQNNAWVVYVDAINYVDRFLPQVILGLKTMKSDSGFVATGTFVGAAATVPPPVSGAGIRMMWYPAKAAFRAGWAGADNWDMAKVGSYSTAFGVSGIASGQASFAIGNTTSATGENSFAFGSQSVASGYASFAGGNTSTASGINSVAFGANNTSSGTNTFTVGNGNNVYGANSLGLGTGNSSGGSESIAGGNGNSSTAAQSIALGLSNTADSAQSFAFGNTNVASGAQSFAGGSGCYANGIASVALGSSSSSTGNYSLAVGNGAGANGAYSVALGTGAIASGTSSFVFGSNITANADYSVVIGTNASSSGELGAMVLADGGTTSITLSAPAQNSMSMRFSGGYKLFSNTALTTGAFLSAGSNAWGVISDKRKKTNFETTDAESFLVKIDTMQLGSWNYKTQDAKTFRHYGPMAQDFYSAFGKDSYGTIGCDTVINSADFAGVSLIAIKALVTRTNHLQKENDALKVRVSVLEAKNTADISTLLNKDEKMQAALVKLQLLVEKMGAVITPQTEGVYVANEPKNNTSQ